MTHIKIENHPLCHYIYHPEGIHEFKLMQPTREGWDVYLMLYTQVAAQFQPDEMVRVLLDSTVGEPPLAYVATSTRTWVRKNPIHPLNRTAVLHINSPLLKIAEVMAKTLRIKDAQSRFFTTPNAMM